MDIVPQLIANSIIAGAIYAMVALGFNLIFSTVKFFDLGYGGLAVIGAYTVFALTKKFATLPLWLGISAGMLVAGLVGLALYYLVYAKLRTRRASSMVMLVAALGLFTAIQAVVAIIFSSQFQTLSASGTRVYEVWGAAITQVQVAILIASLVVMLLLWLLLHRTKFGTMVRAVADDEEVAAIIGIRTKRVIGGVFFIGSMIAGLAGILVGLDTGIEPVMGLPLLLKGVIAAIVGGAGNVFGGVLGAFLLGLVENFGIWHISGEWKDAIAFGLLLVFLIFRPSGIFRNK